MVSAIIAAAGSSSRMNGVNKQLRTLCGVPVFVMSALKFEKSEKVGEIIIAAPENDVPLFEKLAREHGVSKLKAVAAGGDCRMSSVENCLALAAPAADYIAVHDGARPLIETSDIDRVIADAEKYGAAIAAAPAVDTVKVVKKGGLIISGTPDRSELYYAQTPQVFRKELYLSCLEKIKRLGKARDTVTDDSSILEMCGEKVVVTEIKGCNMKITRPEDLFAAESVLKNKQTK